MAKNYARIKGIKGDTCKGGSESQTKCGFFLSPKNYLSNRACFPFSPGAPIVDTRLMKNKISYRIA